MQENISWAEDSHFGKVLHRWWVGLEDDRASRAMLRRCATLDEVALSPAYQRFYRFMLACNWPEDAAMWQNDKLAAIAGLVSHIKTDDIIRLPVKLSETSGDKPLVSELRFRDLLKIETTDDLFVGIRRTLPLIGNKANICHLARDVYWWNDATKKQWAYSYRWPLN